MFKIRRIYEFIDWQIRVLHKTIKRQLYDCKDCVIVEIV